MSIYKDQIDDIEEEVLINMYIYYVIGTRIISDVEYDCLEEAALSVVSENSNIHYPGSSLRESYSENIKYEAVSRLEELTGLDYQEYLQ